MTPQEAIEKRALELYPEFPNDNLIDSMRRDLRHAVREGALFTLSLEGWVSVRERLPEPNPNPYESDNVWGWCEDFDSGAEVRYEAKGKNWTDGERDYLIVTHWRPLPSPPTKDETKL